MSRRQPRRDQPDRETQLDDQEEQQAQSQAGAAAVQHALEDYRQRRQRLISELKNPDFQGPDADAIEEELGTELAGIFALANEDDSDYRRHKWLTPNKIERIKAARNPGRLCDEDLQELAQGTHDRADVTAGKALTAREKRIISAAGEGKVALHSLGKGGKGLESVAEVHAVTEHRRDTDPDADSGSGSFIGRIFS